MRAIQPPHQNLPRAQEGDDTGQPSSWLQPYSTNKIQLEVTRGIPKLTTKQKTHTTASKDTEQIEEFNKHFSGLVLFFLIGSIQANLETIM